MIARLKGNFKRRCSTGGSVGLISNKNMKAIKRQSKKLDYMITISSLHKERECFHGTPKSVITNPFLTEQNSLALNLGS